MSQKKYNMRSFIEPAVTLFALFVVFYTIIAGNYQKTTFADSYTVMKADRWEISLPDGSVDTFCDFPYNADVAMNETYVLTTTLPDMISDDFGFMLYTNYSSIEIRVDGQLINSYALTQPLPIGRLVGNVRLITKLDPSMAGGTLTISYMPFYDNCSNINQISFGNTEALKLSVISNNIWRLALSVFLFTIAIICFGFFIFHEIHRHKVLNRMFLHLGMFLVCVILWLICSSDIPQQFTNANESISLISFLALATMGIYFAGYCEALFAKGKRFFRMIYYIGWSVPLIELIGFVTTWWDPPEVLILNHIYIVFVAIGALICAAFTRKKNTIEIMFIVGVCVVIFAAIISLCVYYVNPTGGADAIGLGIGLTIFSIDLFLMLLHQEIKYVEERKALDIYRNLAYTDPLTGLGNRGAFDKCFEEIKSSANDNTMVQLVLLDINFLKRANDKIGHHAGDALIIAAADCIRAAFSQDADCFRIGGDEFAVLSINRHSKIDSDLKSLDHIIFEYNKNNYTAYKLSLAYGYENSTWNDNPNFFRELFKKADQKMYADKEIKHQIKEDFS